MIYPMHKTADEKRDAVNKKARERRAEVKAKQAVALAARRLKPN
jgi:hypothetical protein